MWVVMGVVILAFALGWFVQDFRALWAPAILGSATVVVHLASEDRETHWAYGFVLGAGVTVSVGVVVLMGMFLADARRRRKRRGQGWLDSR